MEIISSKNAEYRETECSLCEIIIDEIPLKNGESKHMYAITQNRESRSLV